MMNPRNNKKSRSTSSRGSRGKGVEQQLSVEGVYANHHFMHTAGTLVGLTVQVLTKTKEVFEGVLTTFGPKFQLVLDLPHPVSSVETLLVTNAESVKSKMIFEAEDIVVIKVVNVDLEFATRESFAVDGAISGRFNGQAAPERELEPWHGEEDDADSCVGSDLGDLGEGTENGWDANDMFRKNREKYGVITTYSPDMEGYTTPLQRRDTREWREREARAQQIARQIETSPSAQARARLENGEGEDDDDERDEEDKFSAVVRPDIPGGNAPHSGKYMPPQRRKPQGGPGARQPPRGTPSPQGGGPTSIPGAPASGRFTSGPPSQGSPAPSNVSPPAPYVPPPTQPAQKTPHLAHKPSLPPQPNSVPGDPKVNGEAKDSRRREGPPPGPQQSTYVRGDTAAPHKEGAYHPPSQHHSHHHPQQGGYQPHPGPPPTYHGGPPPEGRRSEPREQREPRKPRPLKEDEVANLKKFGQEFKLATESAPDKKGVTAPPPQQQAPQSHHPHQAPPPISTVSKVHLPPQTAPPTTSGPPSQPTAPALPPQHKTETPTTSGSAGPPAGIPHSHNSTHGGAPPSAPPSRPEEGKPPSGANQGTSHPPEDEKVVSSKLNPNAKPFSPRSPSTTTPPRVQTPQIPPPAQSQGAAGGPSVAFQPNMVHPAYVMAAQPFPVPQHRFPNKRGPVGNQRQEYTSPVQVAAATGPPILAQAPLTPITTHQTVPLPQSLMQQTHQYQYAGMPMMVRLSHTPGLPAMVPAIVPTSMGLYYPGGEAPAGAQGHNPQHMYVAPGVHHHHQGHHVATPVPHPGQPPTPQGHSGGGAGPPPNMPTQPPTPGPTPPQGMMYSGPTGAPMGAQPTIPQHLSQHSPHNAQSPHNPYPPHAAMAAHAASHAHAAPATQLVMIPPQMNHHMMPPGVPPPHSGAGHAPTSAGYTPTSSAAMPHVNHAHPLHYIPEISSNKRYPADFQQLKLNEERQSLYFSSSRDYYNHLFTTSGANNQVHSIPLVHHNQ